MYDVTCFTNYCYLVSILFYILFVIKRSIDDSDLVRDAVSLCMLLQKVIMIVVSLSSEVKRSC